MSSLRDSVSRRIRGFHKEYAKHQFALGSWGKEYVGQADLELAIEYGEMLFGEINDTDAFAAVAASAIIITHSGVRNRLHSSVSTGIPAQISMFLHQIVILDISREKKIAILTKGIEEFEIALKDIRTKKHKMYDLTGVPLFEGKDLLSHFELYAEHAMMGMKARDILKHDKRFYNALSVYCSRNKVTLADLLEMVARGIIDGKLKPLYSEEKAL